MPKCPLKLNKIQLIIKKMTHLNRIHNQKVFEENKMNNRYTNEKRLKQSKKCLHQFRNVFSNFILKNNIFNLFECYQSSERDKLEVSLVL